MPSEEMLRIEKEEVRLVLSCCGGPAANKCEEGSGQILMQSVTEGAADGVTEAGMCLSLAHLRQLGETVHRMMIRILASKTSKQPISHYTLDINLLENRLAQMRAGLAALKAHVREEEKTDGAGT